MKRVLAIGGIPGTGKSTLIRKIMENGGPWKREKSGVLELESSADLMIFGKYDEGETFPGTDRLSMAVQPVAKAFVESRDETANIIFEGDRLFNASFVRSLLDMDDVRLKVIVLTVDQKTIKERFVERGSNQDETFLKSRKTKIDNMLGSFDLMEVIEERPNRNLVEQEAILKEIQEFFS